MNPPSATTVEYDLLPDHPAYATVAMPKETSSPITTTNKRKRGKAKATDKPGTFRMSTKTFFLTYPCCPLTPQIALESIQSIFSARGATLKEWIVAQESHQSGDKHLHLYLRLEAPLEIKDPLFFDLPHPHLNEVYHGNYRSCRSPKSVQKYVTKEGNYISNMDLTEEAKEIWKPARKLAKAGAIQEAVDLLETKVYTSLCMNKSKTCCSTCITWAKHGTSNTAGNTTLN